MRRIFTISFLFIAGLAFAQPANDDCNGIIDLGEAPICDNTIYDNSGATATDIGNDNIPNINDCPSVGTMQRDVWFQFTASDTIEDYLITVTGITDGNGSTAMIQPQVAVYRGDCEFDGLEALNCEISDANSSEVSLSLSGLDAGLPYFIRISDWSQSASSNEGTFELCIEEVDIWTPDEDITITTCTGELYDSGGPDEDYEADQNYTVTIAPSALGPDGCIRFTMEYYNVEGADQFTVTDGVQTLINSQDLGDFFGDAGGVNFEVFSSTGEIVLNFQSDPNLQYEGFYATWECSSEPCPETSSIVINNNIDNTDIEEFLSTAYTQVTVVDIVCDDQAKGLFEADELTGLGINKGIVLGSGNVNNFNQPSTNFSSTPLGAPGDEDLDFMSTQQGGALSQDACVIELDIFTNTDRVEFDYIFGSEEYPNFVGSTFNDIFALLISGQGIDGDVNNQENMAVLENGDEVSINTVNFQNNWEYYTSNEPSNTTSNSVVFGGLTSGFQGTPPYLTAVKEVDPCNTYRLKFAIADRGDSAYDSGVFISEIRGSSPEITGATNIDGDYVIESEECKTNGFITFSVDSIPDNDEVYFITTEGTAVIGEDIDIDLPDSIIINSSNLEYTFNYLPIDDGLNDEGDEVLTVNLVRDFGCGEVLVSSYDIIIREKVELQFLNLDSDTLFVCSGESAEIIATGAEVYQWQPSASGIFDPDNEATTTITPTVSTQISLFGFLSEAPNVEECRDLETIDVIVIEPEMEIVTDDPTEICVGDTITLTAQNNVGDSNIKWTPEIGIIDPTTGVIQVSPITDQNITYTASVELQGCIAEGEITISVDSLVVPVVIDDQILCESYPLVLAEDVGPNSTNYEWTPNIYLDNNTISNATTNPEASTTYTLISSSENNYCADTASVEIEVIEADIDILNPVADTVEICLGDTVFVNTLITAGGTGLEWTPNDGTISDISSENFSLYPDVSTTYVGTYTVGPCIATDSIHVKVDSLPNVEITNLIPFKDPYCQGDTVIMTSNIYEPANFPEIEHVWISANGGATSANEYNMVLYAVETTTFERVTTNGACIDTASYFIEVIEPFLSIEPQNPVICPGESLELSGIGPDEMTDFSWTDPENLSCDTCRTTVATPLVTETFTLEAVLRGCSDEADVTVFVTQITGPILSDQTICLDETIVLNENGPVDPDADYTWTLADGSELGFGATLAVSPTETTTYYLLMEEGDCSQEYEVTISVINEEPTITVSADQIICAGETVELSVEASAAGIFTWEPGGIQGETISVSPTDTTLYTVTGDFGCFEVSGTTNVFVGPGFDISSITPTPATDIFEGDQVTLVAETNPAILFEPVTYEWFGEGLVPSSINPITLTAPSVDENDVPFTYYLSMTDGYGCESSFNIELLVDNSLAAIPNVFTPNGDEQNDVFQVIKNEATQLVEFRIFNRWGAEVYAATDTSGWDGLIKGEPAPMDIYKYYIKVRYNDGTEQEFKGEVTLLR